MSKVKELGQKIIGTMTPKVVAITIGGVVVVGGVAIGLTMYFSDSGNLGQQAMNVNQYLEETVRVDNIIVGISESGSTSLNTETVSLTYAATIAEVYANAGQYVEAGDSLVLIDAEAQEEAIEEIQDQLYAQQLSLEATLISAESRKIQAESTYLQQIYTGEVADTSYSLTSADLDAQLAQYDENITDIGIAHAEVETEFYELYDTYNIATLEANVTSASNAVTAANNTLTTANNALTTAKSNLTTQEAKLASFADSADSADKTAATEAVTAATEEVTAAEEAVTAAQTTLTQAQSAYSQAQSALEQAQSNYESTYDQLMEQMEDYVDDIADQYTAKESYYLTYRSQLLSLDSEYNTEVYEYETAQATYDNTIAQIDNDIASAQKSVDDLNDEIASYDEVTSLVVAPVAGYVMTQSEEGNELSAGNTITTIADSTEVNVYVSIAQEDIGDLYVGMETYVVFDAYEDIQIIGEIDTISITPSSGMTSSVSYAVYITCDLTPYEDMVVYEGMTNTVTFIQRQQEDVLVISSKCVTNEDGKQYVKMINELGEIELVEVETGFSDGFDVEIVSGLQEGDIVIIESAVM
ncbi:MAG: HlyD family efflux transporter periplasmic adaptor subunit [Eubacteriales bacterium]